MGQDDSCGICGNYYRNCPHFTKIHAIKKNRMTYCGRSSYRVIAEKADEYGFFLDSQNPDDLCEICKKSTNYFAKMREINRDYRYSISDDFESFDNSEG